MNTPKVLYLWTSAILWQMCFCQWSAYMRDVTYGDKCLDPFPPKYIDNSLGHIVCHFDLMNDLKYLDSSSASIIKDAGYRLQLRCNIVYADNTNTGYDCGIYGKDRTLLYYTNYVQIVLIPRFAYLDSLPSTFTPTPTPTTPTPTSTPAPAPAPTPTPISLKPHGVDTKKRETPLEKLEVWYVRYLKNDTVFKLSALPPSSQPTNASNHFKKVGGNKFVGANKILVQGWNNGFVIKNILELIPSEYNIQSLLDFFKVNAFQMLIFGKSSVSPVGDYVGLDINGPGFSVGMDESSIPCDDLIFSDPSLVGKQVNGKCDYLRTSSVTSNSIFTNYQIENTIKDIQNYSTAKSLTPTVPSYTPGTKPVIDNEIDTMELIALHSIDYDPMSCFQQHYRFEVKNNGYCLCEKFDGSDDDDEENGGNHITIGTYKVICGALRQMLSLLENTNTTSNYKVIGSNVTNTTYLNCECAPRNRNDHGVILNNTAITNTNATNATNRPSSASMHPQPTSVDVANIGCKIEPTKKAKLAESVFSSDARLYLTCVCNIRNKYASNNSFWNDWWKNVKRKFYIVSSTISSNNENQNQNQNQTIDDNNNNNNNNNSNNTLTTTTYNNNNDYKEKEEKEKEIQVTQHQNPNSQIEQEDDISLDYVTKWCHNISEIYKYITTTSEEEWVWPNRTRNGVYYDCNCGYNSEEARRDSINASLIGMVLILLLLIGALIFCVCHGSRKYANISTKFNNNNNGVSNGDTGTMECLFISITCIWRNLARLFCCHHCYKRCKNFKKKETFEFIGTHEDTIIVGNDRSENKDNGKTEEKKNIMGGNSGSGDGGGSSNSNSNNSNRGDGFQRDQEMQLQELDDFSIIDLSPNVNAGVQRRNIVKKNNKEAKRNNSNNVEF